ncbi:MAG: MORN repeat variant [Syntrophorhabdus sp. PtaU1.Bin153]|nr:MAG: MORN repeat variant [Syntrophorhabdus sp. PtaU1.Bin153]
MRNDYPIETTRVQSGQDHNGIHTFIFYRGGEEIAREFCDGSDGTTRVVGAIPDGPVMEYSQTGDLKAVVCYVSNTPEGKAKSFYPDGRVYEEKSFKNGWLVGAYRTYYRDGTLWNECFYVDGVLDGTCMTYYENQAVDTVSHYRLGGLEGDYKAFYLAGGLREAGGFKNGKREGTWTKFYDTGEPESIEEYTNGEIVRRRTYDSEGNLLSDRVAPIPEIEAEKKRIAMEYFDEGIEYTRSGCYERATEAFRNVIAVLPGYRDAYHKLAGTLKRRGMYLHGIEVLMELLKLDPHNGEVHFNIGLAHIVTGNRAAAVDRHEILRDIDPRLARELQTLLSRQTL